MRRIQDVIPWRWWPLLAGIVAVVLLLTLGFLMPKVVSQGARGLPVYGEMPSFSLIDQMGFTVTEKLLRGKVIIANFIFTNCTQFCPAVLSPRMRELQDQLRREGLLGKKVVLLSFSVDPEQDTPEKLRAYAEAFGADPESWRFLTGSPQQMQAAVTGGLKLGLEKIEQATEHMHPDGTVHLHQYDVIHSNSFVLLDSQGRIRAYYNAVIDWKLDKVLNDIRQLAISSR